MTPSGPSWARVPRRMKAIRKSAPPTLGQLPYGNLDPASHHDLQGRRDMQRISSMNRAFKAVAGGVAVFAFGTAFAQLANAGCADFQPVKKAVSWQTPASYFGGLSLLRASDDGDSWHHDDIVGMWRFTMTVPGPNGSTI